MLTEEIYRNDIFLIVKTLVKSSSDDLPNENRREERTVMLGYSFMTLSTPSGQEMTLKK